MLAFENILALLLALVVFTVLAAYAADAVEYVGEILKVLLGGRGIS